jgi:non-specific serine/threonine protein kinase/serine/threonine-protein kinase
MQALEISRRVSGSEHPTTLICMLNLANLYLEEGKYAASERLQGQTLEIERRVLGREHPNTLRSADGLARAYAAQGKYAQAEALLSQSLDTAC